MKRVENEMKAAQKKANDTKKALISLKGKRECYSSGDSQPAA